MNSTQVSSLRASECIRYSEDNKVSENYDKVLKNAIEFCDKVIENTKSDKSTIIETREKYQRLMSENFAFIRNVDKMESAYKEIEKSKDNFTNENKWNKIFEIGQLFKNYDIIEMQEIVSASMIYSAKSYGSRGSAFVISGGNFLDRNPIKENENGREKILLTKKVNEEIKVKDRNRKPIPTQRDLWFEKVWNAYRLKRGNK